MKKVYFISGLGADKRVFSFLDLSFCEPIFIDWISLLNKESLKDYALRLRQEIKDDNPTIVGISFGGMLATEMAKSDSNMKAIIISSNKLSCELPGYFKVAKYFPVYKLFPSFILKYFILLFRGILGAKGKEQNEILKEIIKDTDTTFLKWASGAIVNWGNKIIPENLIHIHGTADKVLPYKLVKASYTIENGTHVMPMNNYEEISLLLKKLI